jgi:acetyltransferase-like isoleucine patch superfamily enzyme
MSWEVYEDAERGVSIRASRIEIGENVSFGRNVTVRVHGRFALGAHSHVGDDTRIEGHNVSIGEHFYGSGGMNIGAGGQQYPDANLTMGARCVVHANTINLCKEVVVGDDVGFSGRVEVITHGFWLSVLDGHPATFKPVKIGSGVILGFGSSIMMGADIAENVVLGAHSLVSKPLDQPDSVYAGAPAKFIRKLAPLTHDQRVRKMEEMIAEYRRIAAHQGISPHIRLDFPWIQVNDLRIDVEALRVEGVEDDETDNFRDFARKWGIRLYTPRGFRTHFALAQGFTGARSRWTLAQAAASES